MNITINPTGNLGHEMVITLSYDELQPHFSKALQEAQREAQIDGFRKGKAPLAMIKQRFGAAIERQALPDIANEVFVEEIKKQEIPVAGVPSMRKATRTEDKGAEFVIFYEVNPTVELQDLSSVVVYKPTKEFTEDDIDAEVNNFRLRTSTTEPADQITDTLFLVKLKFSDIDPATNMPLLGGKERQLFLDDPNIDTILRNDCMNLRRGDSFRYTEEHAAGEHGDHAHTHDYLVTVTEINKLILPEVNDDYVQKLTNNEFTTVAEFRDEIKRGMNERFSTDAHNAMHQQLRNAVIELHEFDVPKSLVVHVAQSMVENVREKNKNDKELKRIPDEQLVRYYLPEADRQVRWELIMDAVIKKENIQMTDADIDEMSEKMGLPAENLKAFFAEDEYRVREFLDTKAFNVVLSQVTLQERPLEDILDEMEENERMAELENGNAENHEDKENIQA